MPINKQELDEAIREFESAIDLSTILSKLAEGKSVEQVRKEAMKKLEIALSGMPRFKDLKPNYLPLEEQLKYIRDIASEVFSNLGSSTPSDKIIREAFIPGVLYKEKIWVHQSSNIDSDAILLSPVLIGIGCDVSSSTIGPYSCIINHKVEGSYVIGSIIGKFE